MTTPSPPLLRPTPAARDSTLDVIRILALFLVLLIHSPVVLNDTGTAAGNFIKHFLGAGAVPAFLILSGFLGARKITLAPRAPLHFIREKTKTLVIPYLLWNGTAILVIFSLKTAGLEDGFRGGGAYFDLHPTLESVASALFGIGRFPILFQFWFLRDLIIAVCAAYFLAPHLPKIPLTPWLFFIIPHPIPHSIGYFLLGCQLYSGSWNERFPDTRSSVVYCLLWLMAGGGMVAGKVSIPFPLLQLGSAAFIGSAAIVLSRSAAGVRFAEVGPATFFVFAVHEPAQTVLAKAWGSSGLPAYGGILCFIGIPAVVFAVGALSYFFLRRMFPRAMSVATGGR